MNFSDAFEKIAKIVHKTAIKKGWYEKERNKGELIALIHSELSEALEYLRKGDKMSDHIPNFKGVEEELADVIIRIMDMSQSCGYRVGQAIEAKIEFNLNRSYKHGGKEF